MQGSYKAAHELYAEESAKNPKFKKIFDDWQKFRAEEAQWFALTELATEEFLAQKLKS
jgi:TRAP-type mannitol/chloroaromatic compound transport system substrate-binding protein